MPVRPGGDTPPISRDPGANHMADFANLLQLWRQAADERAEVTASAKVASRRLQEAQGALIAQMMEHGVEEVALGNGRVLRLKHTLKEQKAGDPEDS